MADATDETWFSDEVATFGDRLEAARESASYSQAELARLLGVNLTTLKAWEADRQEPRGNRLQMLAGMLNVSIIWLMTGQGTGPGVPGDEATLTQGARLALAEIAELRQRMKALVQELARAEAKLDAEIRGAKHG